MSIVLVGKYTSLQDSYMSVVKALEHAAMRCGRKLILQVGPSAHERRVADTLSGSIRVILSRRCKLSIPSDTTMPGEPCVLQSEYFQ